jgi:hypothetical protein
MNNQAQNQDSVQVVTADAAGATENSGDANAVSAQGASEAEGDSDSADESQVDENAEGSESSEDGDKNEGDEEDEVEAKSDEGKPKRKSSRQRRIERLEKTLSFKDQEIEHWKNQALGSKKPGSEKKVEALTEPAAKGKPNPDDFESSADYLEAIADWKLEQKQAKDAAVAKEKAAREAYENQQSEYAKKCAEFAKEHDDFEDVMDAADAALDEAKIFIPIEAQDILMSSEVGAELAYEIAKDPSEFKRICSLPGYLAAREIGKVEARLQKASSQSVPQTKTTKAPAPVKPVGAKGSATPPSLDDPNISFADYERLRLKELNQSR